MLAHWPAWKRTAFSALFCLCVAVLVITVFRGLTTSYPIRVLQVLAAGAAALGLLGMAIAAVTTRLADYSEPEDEEEFERLVIQSERLAKENLAAEPVVTQPGVLPTHGPIEMGRLRPDGQRIDWRIVSLGTTQTALPFIIEDVTPRPLRVPDGAAMHHRLPVTRVAGLIVVVKDLAAATTAYLALLGQQGEATRAEIDGAGAGHRFRVGEQWVALVEPADEAGTLGQYLAKRGEGPYEVALGGSDAVPPGSGELLSLTGTHGARIRIAQ